MVGLARWGALTDGARNYTGGQINTSNPGLQQG